MPKVRQVAANENGRVAQFTITVDATIPRVMTKIKRDRAKRPGPRCAISITNGRMSCLDNGFNIKTLLGFCRLDMKEMRNNIMIAEWIEAALTAQGRRLAGNDLAGTAWDRTGPLGSGF
jgi:hypothetical protein